MEEYKITVRSENETIALNRRTIVFLCIFNSDSLIEGTENSINPFNK